MELDDLDAAILAALIADARRSLREVAQAVGASPTTVGARLVRLEREGLVQGATLRLAAPLLPGRTRLLEGQVEPDARDAVLQRAATLGGVVEAALGDDGRLLVVLQVTDLETEEEISRALAEAGARGLVARPGRRMPGPPLAHLFGASAVVDEPCATCGRAVGRDPVMESVDGRRVLFCCTSCRRLYLERYEEMKRRAAGGTPQ